MDYNNGKVVKAIASGDGRLRVDIVARYDGHFQFHEHKFVEADKYSGPHWEPGWISGIYLSAELAEREASAHLPWLRDQISN